MSATKELVRRIDELAAGYESVKLGDDGDAIYAYNRLAAALFHAWPEIKKLLEECTCRGE